MKAFRSHLYVLLIALFGFLYLSSQPASAQDAQDLKITYQTPPKAIAGLVDSPPTPGVSFSYDRNHMLLLESPGLPSIEEVSQPELRLAGLRINPRTNGPSRSGHYTGITIRDIETNTDRKVTGLPDNAKISSVSWSPDGARFAFLLTKSGGIELWVADLKSAKARKLTEAVINNAWYGSPYEWLPDGETLLALFVDPDRGEAPQENPVPSGPVLQQNLGKSAPARTYQDLLEDAHDEELFDYYFTSQLMQVDLKGKTRKVGTPGIFVQMSSSPDGKYILTGRIHQPYSYIVPAYRFPERIQVWDRRGNVVQEIADLPLAEEVPTGFSSVPEGVRSVSWRADDAATLYWVEALDEGNANIEADKRDRLFMLQAPFDGEAKPLTDLEYRYSGVRWSEEGYALVNEYWWNTRQYRIWKIRPDASGTTPELIFEYSTEDRYNNPGSPEMKRSRWGTWVLHTLDGGNTLLLTGQGASPEGNRPFLDKFNLETKETERLWRSEAPYYEYVVTVLEEDGSRMLTRRESVNEQPNYFIRNVANGELRQITKFEHPHPDLDGIQKEFITYKRGDGVQLSATLYLPPGYDREKDGPLPMLMWAYPREFKSADAAGQITDSPYRFNRISYWGPHFLLTQGYAVLDGPTMPIIGEGEDEPNDTYVEQLVTSAQAAADEVVGRGVADRNRLAIGGHSYGAFMTANLLAHSDIYRAGIARSGAYNRTLTPFGFQAEQRTYWEAPEIYYSMSPFMHADKIDEPMLMIHGQADNNSGTFPIQSERMYHAMKGLGGTVRLVMLPDESHGYRARESILHMLWEQNEWMENYVKNAETREIEKKEVTEGSE